MKAACSSGLSFGGAVVLVATFTPSSMKKFSWPAGEQMQSSRAALEELLWNWCGAFEGMLMVSPALTMDFFPRKVASTSPSRRMKVSSKSWRWGRRATAGRNVHVNDAKASVGLVAGHGDGIGISHDADVRKSLIRIGLSNGEVALRIVGRNGRVLRSFLEHGGAPLVDLF